MPTLPNMGLITPTLGGDSGTWDDKINACFALLDAHDHTSGKGVAVPVSGLNINADFVMGGNAITGLDHIEFDAITPLASGSQDLFVSDVDNELYWRTASGSNVKLTSGTSINTTLVGGIVGDYSSVGAELAYSDADEVYTFKQDDGTWASIAGGTVKIYEHGTTESVYVEFKAPTALVTTYTVTWPLAPPSERSMMIMATDGTISTPTAATTYVGQIAADEYKIADGAIARRVINLANGQQTGGGGHIYNINNWVLTTTSVAELAFPIELERGDRIKTIAMVINKASNGSNTLTMRLDKTDGLGTATSILDGGAALTNSANAPGTITLGQTLGTPYTFITRECVTVYISHSANPASASDTIYAVEVTYDHP